MLGKVFLNSKRNALRVGSTDLVHTQYTYTRACVYSFEKRCKQISNTRQITFVSVFFSQKFRIQDGMLMIKV